jgi:hypothetical protein
MLVLVLAFLPEGSFFMRKTKLLVLGVFLMLVLELEACALKPTIAPSITALPTTFQVVTQTLTSTPTLTITPSATALPTAFQIVIQTPTNIPTPLPAKQVILSFGVGVGGNNYSYYFGDNIPDLLLFSDGEIIQRQFDDNHKEPAWFAENKLTTPQICLLFAQIKKLGYFDVPGDGTLWNLDPIYKSDKDIPLLWDAPNYVIDIYANMNKRVIIYSRYVPYLVPEIKRTLNLLENYKLPNSITPYQPKSVLLLIQPEASIRRPVSGRPIPAPEVWPSSLPSLESLIKDNLNAGYLEIPGASVTFYTSLIEGKDVKTLMKLYNNRLDVKQFSTPSGNYFVILRPLLPNETLSTLNDPNISFGKTFKPPFACPN